MNESNNINIKARNSNMLVQGISFLAFAVVSLAIALTPFLSSDAMKIKTLFFIVGGVLFLTFISLFVYLLYKECVPQNALIINSRGFIDLLNVGENIVIDWTNIANVKILGKNNVKYFTVTLENADIVLAKMKGKKADEMRENIEENLPHIIISQKNLRISVKELQEIFTKLIREARVLSSEQPKKVKNNPFSTDDVLRAFGKLPKNEEQEEQDETASPVNYQDLPSASQDNDNVEKETEPLIDESEASEESETDSFYAMLQQKTAKSEESEPVVETTEEPSSAEDSCDVVDVDEQPSIADEPSVETKSSDEDMPDEIKTLLSKARSSKITEIEKLLSDSETPVSHKRAETSSPISKTDTETVVQPEPNLDNGSDESPVVESNDDVPVNSFDDLKISLGDDASEPKKVTPHDSKTDTIEFISKKTPQNEDDFIIPDPIEYNDDTQD